MFQCEHCNDDVLPFAGQRTIRGLAIRCTGRENGCDWHGTVATLDDHLLTCQFTLIPCPKKCRDANRVKVQVMRKDMENHLANHCPYRPYQCPRCGKKENFTYITNFHDQYCEKKRVKCPECKLPMLQGELKDHLQNVCEEIAMPCKFESLGCKAQLKRREKAAHEEDNEKLHLNLALELMSRLRLELGREARTTALTFKLTNYQLLKQQNQRFVSPWFYTSRGGYKMGFSVYPNGKGVGLNTHLSIFAHIYEGENDSHLNWPLVGNITFTLLNQLEDRHHETESLTLNSSDNAHVTEEWGFKKFISHGQLGHNQQRNTMFLKDDCLYFKVYVEVPGRKPWLECSLQH